MSNNEITDILENLKQQNESLFNNLIFANKCLKYSIEFISFVDLIFKKVDDHIEEKDISKFEKYVSTYESMLKGIKELT